MLNVKHIFKNVFLIILVIEFILMIITIIRYINKSSYMSRALKAIGNDVKIEGVIKEGNKTIIKGSGAKNLKDLFG